MKTIYPHPLPQRILCVLGVNVYPPKRLRTGWQTLLRAHEHMIGLEISEAKCSHNLGFQRYATVQSIPGEFVGLTVKLYTVRALGVRRIIKKPATAFAQHTEQDKSSENYPL